MIINNTSEQRNRQTSAIVSNSVHRTQSVTSLIDAKVFKDVCFLVLRGAKSLGKE